MHQIRQKAKKEPDGQRSVAGAGLPKLPVSAPKSLTTWVVGVMMCFVPAHQTSAAESGLCSQITQLIEHSKNEFSEVKGDQNPGNGSHRSNFVLRNATDCLIFDDFEKTAYQCAWVFSYQDPEAAELYRRFTSEIRSCIGDIAREHRDQPVNHPDFYASYYFRMPTGEVSVTLKNKSELRQTFVFIGVDGFK